MLTVSNSIKNAYKKYTTQRKSYIQVGNNSFFVQNLDVQADAYDEGNVIGNAIAKIAKFEIETEYVGELDEFELFDGIWTGNQYEYVSLGTFKLFDEEGTDDFFSSITAYDKLINFNAVYDPSNLNFPMSLYDFLKGISNQAGVELENTSIPNGNQILQSNIFVEGETLKQILKAICQINGCIGIISKDKLKLLLKGTETLNLSKYQISNPEYKRKTWGINQVVLGMADVDGEYVIKQDDEDIQKNGVHKLIINDNPFVFTQALREQYIENLFHQVKGFGYTAFETKWEGLPYIELGDQVNIDGHESIIFRYNLKSPNGLESTLSAPSIIDSAVEYVDNADSIENKQKRTEVLVNKANQQIQLLSQKVVDISKTEKGIGELILSNASETTLYKLVIKNACQQFPSKSTFLSSNTFLKNSNLIVTYEDETEQIYKLPILSLRSFQNVYDDMTIENGIITQTKRIGYNEIDGSLYILDEPITTNLGEIFVDLREGTNKIKLQTFPSAILEATYLLKNDYTDVFSNKAETKAEIEVAADEINLEVSQKVDSDEIISAINLSPEEVQIKGNKISLEGVVTANENFKILEDGSMETTDGKFSGTVTGSLIKGSSFTGSSDESIKLEIGYNSDDTSTLADNSFKIIRNDGENLLNIYGKYWSAESLKTCQFLTRANRYTFYGGPDGAYSLAPLHAGAFNQSSLKNTKKNFEKLSNSLSIIKQADIYTYNLKKEKKHDKKHIGLVIGDDYNTPKEILSSDETAVDLYSMISVAWQAIKEQQEIIEKLRNKIEILEKNNKNKGE